MNESYEKTYHRLLSTTPIKARSILREIEESPMDLERFYRQSLRLKPGRAIMLCPLLSAMFSHEFMELLRNYVLSTDRELSQAALEALAKANVTARREVLVNLLSVGSDEIKIRICRIFGEEGSEDAGRVLAGVLNESSVEVLIAALRAIKKIERISYLDRCEEFLVHTNEKVRFAALQLYEKWSDNIARSKVLGMLRTDSSLEVRVLAVRVLEEDRSEQALDAFIDIIKNGDEKSEVRCEIARALKGVDSKPAAKALFKICAEENYDFKLIQLSRTSLIKIPEDILYPMCEDVFKHEALMPKIEAVRIAGTVGTEVMKEFLSRKLAEETDEVILAALFEESARLKNADCWAQALLLLGESPIISYAAAQALALLLIPEKLNDFIIILNGKHENIVYEVILERLASYGRARGLPWEYSGYIEKFLKHDYANIAVLAAEAASYVNGGALVGSLLDAIGHTDRNEVNHAICTGIMQAVNKSMTKLIDLAGPERLLKLAAVISYMGDDILAEVSFFVHLAGYAEKGCDNLHLCLILSARTNMVAFVQAFERCRGAALAALINAWKSLPHGLRAMKKLNWVRLLTISDPQVRLLALKAITPEEAQSFIGYLADINFLDPDPKIRDLAAEVLREALLVQAKEKIGVS